MTRRVPSTDGVDLALHDLGGSGPPLLVLHATGFHGRAYLPMAASLRNHFHVWAPDLRGHGMSTPPEHGDFSWTGMSEDVLHCVDALGLTSVHVFGHSMGGAAGLVAELMRPGLLAGAFLFEPIVYNPTWIALRDENPMSGPARRRRAEFPSRAEALYRYGSRPPLSELRADALWAYVEHGFVDLPDGTVRLACLPEHEARTFEAEDKMTLDVVRDLTVPLVVGVGDLTPSPGPADLARALAELLPQARLVEYPFQGHFGPFQEPERIAADLIRAFAPRL